MAEQIDETARAELAYAFLKKHFARAGVEIQRDKLPTSWFGFTMLLCDNVEPLVRHGGHDAMLRGLFAEVIGLTAGFSGEYFAYNLYELLKSLIESHETRARLKPLLPPEAQAKMDEIVEMLHRDWEDARRRADEGYY